jgi:hypothetical protein
MIALALDFTSALLDPRITFSRADNTATRVGNNGLIETVSENVARFDFDPLTLACNGLLIESERANLLLQSENFGAVNWSRADTSFSENVAVAPNGQTTADLLTEGTAGTAITTQTVSSSGPTVAYSLYIKAGTATWVRLQITSGANAIRLWFNASTGAIGNTSVAGTGVFVSCTFEAYANGWYRLELVGTIPSVTIFNATINSSPSNGSPSRVNNASYYPWGAQLEVGSEATSYIPTTTTSLTRNADVATITGSNFTSFWNATQGGATVQATQSTVSGIRPLVQYDDGTANEIIALRGNTTNPELYIVDDGTPQAQLDAGTIAANTAYSLTGWWETNDCRARKDSGAAVTDATATIPTVTQARIGSDGTNYLNGTIATINYYAAFSSHIYTRRKNKVVSSLF